MNYCSLVQLSVVALVLLLLGNASRSLADDASTSPPAQAQTGTPPQDNAARVSPPAAASLITDGGFENGATGLSLLVPSGMGDKNCRFDIVSANPHSGTSCLRLQSDNFARFAVNTSPGRIPVQPGQRYHVSVWFRADPAAQASPQTPGFLVRLTLSLGNASAEGGHLHILLGNKVTRSNAVPSPTVTLPTNWTHIEAVVEIPAGVDAMTPELFAWMTKGAIFADDFSIEKVDDSTPVTQATITNPAPVYPPTTPGIVLRQDVVIGKGGDSDLHADIAYPQNIAGPLTAVIYIHGGGWREGSYHTIRIIQLATAGFFAASIEYRLSNVAKWPAQIQDCKLGVRWLRANAAQYHIDPDHIGVWGESAGGHLVACLGTMGDVKDYEGNGGYPGVSSTVQAVVDWFGPTDFTNLTADNSTPSLNSVTEGLFGMLHDQNPDLWKSGSPLAYVKAGDPPTLIVQGDSDHTVPLAQSTVFDAALTQAGVTHQFIIVKNAGHSFKPLPGTTTDPGLNELKQTVYAFFAKYLKGL